MDRKRLNLKTRTATNLRVKQAENRAVSRSNARSNAFARGRNMDNLNAIDILEDEETPIDNKAVSNAENTNNVTDARRIRLEKWKTEKLQKEAVLKSKQKPIFKTGVVHHSVGSPQVFGVPATTFVPNKIVDTRNGATTRAMRTNMLKTQAAQPSKRLVIQAISQETKFRAPTGIKAMSMLTIPITPKGMSARKKLQPKPHVHCMPSTVSISAGFPVVSGQQKKSSVNHLVFGPKITTPNVLLPKTILKPKTPTNGISQQLNAVFKPKTPNAGVSKQMNAFSKLKTPNAGVPKQMNAGFKLKTPNAGIVKQLSSALNPTTPSVERGVNVLSTGLAPILDESPEVHKPVVDPQASTPVGVFIFSPHVTVERGKYSDRRRSVKARPPGTGTPLAIPIASLSMDDSDAGAVTDGIQHGSLHPAVQYRNKLNAEINRLNTVCGEWTTFRTDNIEKLSDNVNSLIDLAVGQAQLLIRSKFEQFRGLTFDCEKGECKPPVTVEDLQGFWEMVYIQVENIDKQFCHLTELKLNDFKEESPTKGVTKKRNPKKTSRPVVPKVTAKSSGIRALIAAQRQKLQKDGDKVATPKVLPRTTRLSITPKATPHIARSSSTPRQSSSRASMLKDVLKSSALRRSQNLSPIIMRVSQMAKRVGSPTVSTSTADKPPIDSKSQTPYKSILKDISIIDSAVKEGRKTVNFGQSTIKDLTPDFDAAFESPADELPARYMQHLVVESSVEENVRLCVAPTEHVEILETHSITLKRRTTKVSHLGTYQAETAGVEGNTETGNQSEVDKENLAINSSLPKKMQTRQRVMSFVDGTPEQITPQRTRCSYRKTPYKKTDRKVNKPLAECPPDSPAMEFLLDTATSSKSRRSYRKTPSQAIINNQSNDDQRVSLLPGMGENSSPGKATRFSTGDLISFNTPLRRSTRTGRNY